MGRGRGRGLNKIVQRFSLRKKPESVKAAVEELQFDIRFQSSDYTDSRNVEIKDNL